MSLTTLRLLEKSFDLPISKTKRNIVLHEENAELIVPIKSSQKSNSVRGYKRKINIILCSDVIIFYHDTKKRTLLCKVNKNRCFFVLPLKSVLIQKVARSPKLILTQKLSSFQSSDLYGYQYPINVVEKFISPKNFVKVIICLNIESLGKFYNSVSKSIEILNEKINEEEEELNIEIKEKTVFEKMINYYSKKKNENETNFKNTNGCDEYIRCIKVLEEILNSERDYVLDLCTLVNDFLQPLTTNFKTNLIITEAVKIIFSNVGSILEVNAEILKALTDDINKINVKQKNPSVESIVEIIAKQFMKHMDFLKMYSLYCHQYKSNLIKLTELRNNCKEFTNQVNVYETKTKQLLQSLLIKPVQRICKYPLLFRELLKNMNQIKKVRTNDHIFSKVVDTIKITCESIENITSSVNSKVQDIENQQFVLQVYLELGGEKDKQNLNNLLSPTRRFKACQETLIREHSSKNPQKRISCVVYLFNDMLIIGKLCQSLLGRTFSSSTSHNQQKYLSNQAGQNNTTSTANGSNMKQRAKLLHKFDFTKSRVRIRKSINDVVFDKQKRCPFQIVVTTSSTNTETKKVESQVEKFEVWCESKDVRDIFSMQIAENIHETQKLVKERANKPSTTDRRINVKELKKLEVSSPTISLREKRVQNLEDNRNNLTTTSNLKAIAEKYRLEEKSYQVTFGEGLFGISFQNGYDDENKEEAEHPKRRGVYVAIVSENGQASKFGVKIGDKLVQINTTVVKDSATWKQVFEVLKKIQRPVTLKFIRSQTMTLDIA